MYCNVMLNNINVQMDVWCLDIVITCSEENVLVIIFGELSDAPHNLMCIVL
jgi:hypothetical protein